MKIPLNFSPDTSQKCDEFSKTLPKKSFKFSLYKRNSIVVFNISFVLLLAKINLILKEQGRGKDILGACGTGYVKIVLALSTKIIALDV